MIEAFNALLSCLVTGLFTALFLAWFAHIGILPITLVLPIDQLEEIEEDDDPTH